MNNYATADIDRKLLAIESDVAFALNLSVAAVVPNHPLRPMPICEPGEMPRRSGLSSKEGQLRLIHDLGNIELQAMELALRTLLEYPEAPADFRNALGDLCLSEAQHFRLTLRVLRNEGYDFGAWPVHMGLWRATHRDQTLVERVLVVHRYLEGSGLDAGNEILQKLRSVKDLVGVSPVVATIAREEIDHVAFGSRWYKTLCSQYRIDESETFKRLMADLYSKIPKREPIHEDLRRQAGFTEDEISFLKIQRENSLHR